MFQTAKPHRTGAPIRRNSYQAGHCEAGFWRSISRRTGRRILAAAKHYSLTRRAPGRRNGPIGHIAIEILELLVGLVDFRSGRLEPGLDYLQRRLRRSRSAIVAALAELRQCGFLDWRRRYDQDGNEGKGKPPRQVTNAYRLALPPAAAIMLGLFGLDAPMPDDAAVRLATSAFCAEVAEAESLAEVQTLENFKGYANERIDASPALLRSRIFASSPSGLNPKVDQNS